MDLEIKLDKGAFMPIREHKTDAGLDIRSRDDRFVPPKNENLFDLKQSEVFHTGVHIKLPPNTAGILISKSGLNIHYNITSTGLIDEGYDGEIVVKLYNHGFFPYHVKKGDKISQLVIVPVLYCTPKVVENLNQHSERGDKGFGSTGK